MKLKINEMGVQIVDHCNLNCKGCLHFCHKDQNPYFYEPSRYERDLKQLTSFVDIDGIRIYGGEPLLHPELSKIIEISHKIAPNAQLKLYTNGLLLRTISKNLVFTLRKHGVTIIWSVYPVFDNEHFASIVKFLDAESLSFYAERTEKFYSCLRLEGDIDPQYAFERCNGRYCHIMQDGQISLCPAPMVAKTMRSFGFNFDLSDGLLDIYDKNITAQKIISFLNSPHSACSFCAAPNYFSWQPQLERVSLIDWVSKEDD